MATKKPAPLANVQAPHSTALAAITKEQKALAKFLNELQTWMELPFASPKYLAQSGATFTLHKHGETSFPDEQTGEAIPTHLWLATAQGIITYVNNAGDEVEFADGDKFIISQRKNVLRDRIADTVNALLEEAPIPNVYMRTAKIGKKARANGWSAPVTFAVHEETIEVD